MSQQVRQGDQVPHDLAEAVLGDALPQHLRSGQQDPNAGWMQPGAQASGPAVTQARAVTPERFAYQGEQRPQQQPAPPHAMRGPNTGDGLAAVTALAAGQRRRRSVVRYSFPSKVFDQMPDVKPEHRSFTICRLTVPEEARAQAEVGMSVMSSATVMAKAAVWTIGTEPALYDLLEGIHPYPGGWWEAIGPVGRRLVEQAYVKTNQPANDVGEQMVESGEPDWA